MPAARAGHSPHPHPVLAAAGLAPPSGRGAGGEGRLDPVIILLTLLALALRLWNLPGLGDLEFDEIVSVRYAELSPAALVAQVAAAPFEHPPLFYLALGFWRDLFPDTIDLRTAEALSRAFSAIISTLLVPVLAALARRSGGITVARLAALLAAIAPLLVFYGREVRMYAPLATLVALVVWLWWRAIERPTWLRWALVVVASWVAVYTHFLALAVPAGLGLWLAISWRRGVTLPWRAATVASGIGVAGLVPWLIVAPGVAASLPAVAPSHLSWSALGAAGRQAAVALAVGPPIGAASWATGAAAGWLLLIVLGLLPQSGQRPGATSLLALCLLTTILGAGSVLVIDKPFSSRYVLAAAPFALVAAARGIVGLQRYTRTAAAAVAVGVLLIGVVAFGASYYFGYTRADYSRITERIAALERPGDTVLLTGPWQAWYYDYYYRGSLPHAVLPTTVPPAVDEAAAAAALTELTQRHDRLWLALAGLAQSDPQRLVERWLLSHAWQGDRRAYATGELSIFKLHPRLEAPLRAARFGEEIEFVGGLTEMEEVPSGDVAPFTLRFRALRALTADYRASLRLVGWDGQRVAKDFDLRAAPLTGAPTSRWPPGDVIEIRQGLWLPVGLGPGSYDVELVICDQQSLRPLPPSWPGDDRSGAALIGRLDVTYSRARLRIERESNVQPRHVAIGDEWDAFILAGARLDTPSPVAPGDPLALLLAWQVGNAYRNNHRTELALVNQTGDIVLQRERLPLAGAVPSQEWREGEIIFDRHEWSLPRNLPPGPYRLLVRLRTDAGVPLWAAGYPDGWVPVLTLDISPPNRGIRRRARQLVTFLSTTLNRQ